MKVTIIKTIMFFLIVIYFPSLDAMQFTGINPIIGINPMRAFSSHIDVPGTNKNGIYPYQDIYKDKVMDIASKNMPALVSLMDFKVRTPEYLKSKAEEHVGALLDSYETDPESPVKVKVYVKDGQPVGFISYSIYTPWHRSFIPFAECIGPNASIYHLAIDETHQAKGYGSDLMKNVLEDCKTQSVNCVSLWTTWDGDTASGKGRLGNYYARFGFTLAHASRHHADYYTLRLKAHPLSIILSQIYAWIKGLSNK